jgi:low temperature requirement protein LtrA
MTTGAARILRKPGQSERATFLELFFDLVFIFALAQVSRRLVEDLTSERRIVLTEAGQTLVVLLALWVVWYATALITDLYDPGQPKIQLLVVASMFGSLVMAVAVPAAFGPRGLAFAGAYVTIHLGRGLVLVPALRGHVTQRRAARVWFWFGVSAVPWLAGAMFTGVVRGALWTVAIALDYAAQVLRTPVPGLGRAPESELPVVAEHLAERYQQFFIIALGELILVTGLTFSDADLGPGSTAAFGVSFATTVLLWRIYIHRAGALLPAAIATARLPGRSALSLSVAHLGLVVGIVAAAAGFELAIVHPTGRTDPAWAAVILGGPALFLVARGALEYAVFRRVSKSRVAGAVVLAAAVPVMTRTPPLAVAVAATAVLLGVALSDALRDRTEAAEPSTDTFASRDKS